MRVSALVSCLMTAAVATALPGRGRMHEIPSSSSMAAMPSSASMEISSSSSVVGTPFSHALASATPSMLKGLDHFRGGFTSPSSSAAPSSSSAVAAAASAAITPPSIVQTAPINTKTCSSGLTKQCCISLNKDSKEITQPLGAVLPVGGVKLSSILGISCVPMKDTDVDALCQETIMCCNSGSMLGLGIAQGCEVAG